MTHTRIAVKASLALFAGALICGNAGAAPKPTAPKAAVVKGVGAASPVMQKRWLFFWRTMSDPKDVDRTIAQFPARAGRRLQCRCHWGRHRAVQSGGIQTGRQEVRAGHRGDGHGRGA